MPSSKITEQTSDISVDRIGLIDALPIPYLAYQAQPPYLIIDENQAHEKVAFTKRKDIIGKPFLEVFPDTSEEFKATGKSKPIESIKRIVRSRKPDSLGEFKYDVRDKNGRFVTKYWRSVQYPILDKDKKVVAIYQLTEDITERKDTERALRESEDRLRFMADSMPQLVWVADAEGHYEYFNQRWYQYTGTTGNEASSDVRIDQIHPAERKMARQVWRDALKSGEPYELQYRLYRAPSASYRWVIGRAYPTLNAAGKPVKWYGTCTDIDEQKRVTQLQTFLAEASKQMNESLDYLNNLEKVAKLCVAEIADWCSVDMYDETTGTIDQVVVAHADPKKVSLAREYRQHNPPVADGTSGVSKVIINGEPEFYPVITNKMIAAYITEPDKRAFMLSLNLHSLIIVPFFERKRSIGALSFVSTDSGRHYSESDLRMAQELASRVSVAVTNSKLYDESKREIEQRKRLQKELLLEKQKLESRVKERTEQLQLTNVGLREEIAKRHLIEEELQNKSQNLAQSNQELQDFAYVASHDLQEPLRKIQAFGNLLENEYGQELGEGTDYLRRMRNAASRMSVLIEDLLSFSRVTTQAKPSVDVDLNVVVGEVLQDLESRIAETNGRVDVEELPTVKADPTHMRQLFQNLIGNALKFHKPDLSPHVKVEFTGDGPDYVEIRIIDNGIGFDQKYIDRIFAVFQRLHERGAYDGTGIGLAVVRKIVERYGGTITAKSSKNNGATFIIRLSKKNEVEE